MASQDLLDIFGDTTSKPNPSSVTRDVPGGAAVALGNVQDVGCSINNNGVETRDELNTEGPQTSKQTLLSFDNDAFVHGSSDVITSSSGVGEYALDKAPKPEHQSHQYPLENWGFGTEVGVGDLLSIDTGGSATEVDWIVSVTADSDTKSSVDNVLTASEFQSDFTAELLDDGLTEQSKSPAADIVPPTQVTTSNDLFELFEPKTQKDGSHHGGTEADLGGFVMPEVVPSQQSENTNMDGTLVDFLSSSSTTNDYGGHDTATLTTFVADQSLQSIDDPFKELSALASQDSSISEGNAKHVGDLTVLSGMVAEQTVEQSIEVELLNIDGNHCLSNGRAKGFVTNSSVADPFDFSDSNVAETTPAAWLDTEASIPAQSFSDGLDLITGVSSAVLPCDVLKAVTVDADSVLIANKDDSGSNILCNEPDSVPGHTLFAPSENGLMSQGAGSDVNDSGSVISIEDEVPLCNELLTTDVNADNTEDESSDMSPHELASCLPEEDATHTQCSNGSDMSQHGKYSQTEGKNYLDLTQDSESDAKNIAKETLEKVLDLVMEETSNENPQIVQDTMACMPAEGVAMDVAQTVMEHLLSSTVQSLLWTDGDIYDQNKEHSGLDFEASESIPHLSSNGSSSLTGSINITVLEENDAASMLLGDFGYANDDMPAETKSQEKQRFDEPENSSIPISEDNRVENGDGLSEYTSTMYSEALDASTMCEPVDPVIDLVGLQNASSGAPSQSNDNPETTIEFESKQGTDDIAHGVLNSAILETEYAGNEMDSAVEDLNNAAEETSACDTVRTPPLSASNAWVTEIPFAGEQKSDSMSATAESDTDDLVSVTLPEVKHEIGNNNKACDHDDELDSKKHIPEAIRQDCDESQVEDRGADETLLCLDSKESLPGENGRKDHSEKMKDVMPNVEIVQHGAFSGPNADLLLVATIDNSQPATFSGSNADVLLLATQDTPFQANSNTETQGQHASDSDVKPADSSESNKVKFETFPSQEETDLFKDKHLIEEVDHPGTTQGNSDTLLQVLEDDTIEPKLVEVPDEDRHEEGLQETSSQSSGEAFEVITVEEASLAQSLGDADFPKTDVSNGCNEAGEMSYSPLEDLSLVYETKPEAANDNETVPSDLHPGEKINMVEGCTELKEIETYSHDFATSMEISKPNPTVQSSNNTQPHNLVDIKEPSDVLSPFEAFELIQVETGSNPVSSLATEDIAASDVFQPQIGIALDDTTDVTEENSEGSSSLCDSLEEDMSPSLFQKDDLSEEFSSESGLDDAVVKNDVTLSSQPSSATSSPEQRQPSREQNLITTEEHQLPETFDILGSNIPEGNASQIMEVELVDFADHTTQNHFKDPLACNDNSDWLPQHGLGNFNDDGQHSVALITVESKPWSAEVTNSAPVADESQIAPVASSLVEPEDEDFAQPLVGDDLDIKQGLFNPNVIETVTGENTEALPSTPSIADNHGEHLIRILSENEILVSEEEITFGSSSQNFMPLDVEDADTGEDDTLQPDAGVPCGQPDCSLPATQQELEFSGRTQTMKDGPALTASELSNKVPEVTPAVPVRRKKLKLHSDKSLLAEEEQTLAIMQLEKSTVNYDESARPQEEANEILMLDDGILSPKPEEYLTQSIVETIDAEPNDMCPEALFNTQLVVQDPLDTDADNVDFVAMPSKSNHLSDANKHSFAGINNSSEDIRENINPEPDVVHNTDSIAAFEPVRSNDIISEKVSNSHVAVTQSVSASGGIRAETGSSVSHLADFGVITKPHTIITSNNAADLMEATNSVKSDAGFIFGSSPASTDPEAVANRLTTQAEDMIKVECLAATERSEKHNDLDINKDSVGEVSSFSGEEIETNSVDQETMGLTVDQMPGDDSNSDAASIINAVKTEELPASSFISYDAPEDVKAESSLNHHDLATLDQCEDRDLKTAGCELDAADNDKAGTNMTSMHNNNVLIFGDNNGSAAGDLDENSQLNISHLQPVGNTQPGVDEEVIDAYKHIECHANDDAENGNIDADQSLASTDSSKAELDDSSQASGIMSPPSMEFDDDPYSGSSGGFAGSITNEAIKRSPHSTQHVTMSPSTAYVTGHSFSTAVPSSVFIDVMSDNDSAEDSLEANDTTSSEEADDSDESDDNLFGTPGVLDDPMLGFIHAANESDDVGYHQDSPYIVPSTAGTSFTYQGFDAGWEEIAQTQARFVALPVIMEEPEPHDAEHDETLFRSEDDTEEYTDAESGDDDDFGTMIDDVGDTLLSIIVEVVRLEKQSSARVENGSENSLVDSDEEDTFVRDFESESERSEKETSTYASDDKQHSQTGAAAALDPWAGPHTTGVSVAENLEVNLRGGDIPEEMDGIGLIDVSESTLGNQDMPERTNADIPSILENDVRQSEEGFFKDESEAGICIEDEMPIAQILLKTNTQSLNITDDVGVELLGATELPEAPSDMKNEEESPNKVLKVESDPANDLRITEQGSLPVEATSDHGLKETTMSSGLAQTPDGMLLQTHDPDVKENAILKPVAEETKMDDTPNDPENDRLKFEEMPAKYTVAESEQFEGSRGFDIVESYTDVTQDLLEIGEITTTANMLATVDSASYDILNNENKANGADTLLENEVTTADMAAAANTPDPLSEDDNKVTDSEINELQTTSQNLPSSVQNDQPLLLTSVAEMHDQSSLSIPDVIFPDVTENLQNNTTAGQGQMKDASNGVPKPVQTSSPENPTLGAEMGDLQLSKENNVPPPPPARKRKPLTSDVPDNSNRDSEMDCLQPINDGNVEVNVPPPPPARKHKPKSKPNQHDQQTSVMDPVLCDNTAGDMKTESSDKPVRRKAPLAPDTSVIDPVSADDTDGDMKTESSDKLVKQIAPFLPDATVEVNSDFNMNSDGQFVKPHQHQKTTDELDDIASPALSAAASADDATSTGDRVPVPVVMTNANIMLWSAEESSQHGTTEMEYSHESDHVPASPASGTSADVQGSATETTLPSTAECEDLQGSEQAATSVDGMRPAPRFHDDSDDGLALGQLLLPSVLDEHDGVSTIEANTFTDPKESLEIVSNRADAVLPSVTSEENGLVVSDVADIGNESEAEEEKGSEDMIKTTLSEDPYDFFTTETETSESIGQIAELKEPLTMLAATTGGSSEEDVSEPPHVDSTPSEIEMTSGIAEYCKGLILELMQQAFAMVSDAESSEDGLDNAGVEFEGETNMPNRQEVDTTSENIAHRSSADADLDFTQVTRSPGDGSEDILNHTVIDSDYVEERKELADESVTITDDDFGTDAKPVTVYTMPLKDDSDTTNDFEMPRQSRRVRHDTSASIGSIRYLTDSEDEDEMKNCDQRVVETLVSLDDEAIVDDDVPQTITTDFTTSGEPLTKVQQKSKRKSLVPPSSLILSVALDDVAVPDKQEPLPGIAVIKEDAVLANSDDASFKSVEIQQNIDINGSQEGSGDTPQIPILMVQNQSVADEPQPVIQTQLKLIKQEDVIPISPMPSLRRTVRWEKVTVKNVEYKIDEAAIQPYKRVISHGGFYDAKSPIIEIFTSYLPSSNLEHYAWVMDNLFLYVLATIELLAQERFSIVLFVGSTPKSQIPANTLLKRWHQHVDYKLKKNVEAFYIVNPTFYFRTMARIFVSRKVLRKLKYIKSMTELKTFIPTDFLFVPSEIAR